MRHDQAMIGAGLVIFLACSGGWWILRERDQGWVEIDRADKRRIDLKIDINKASWAELSLLPGVGEARAKAIVASREKEGPFTRPDDLRRIRGFGPRTIEGLRGYLSPLPGEAIYVESGRDRHATP